MFDFNGDGKIDLAESFIAFSIFEEMTRGEPSPSLRNARRSGPIKRAYEKMEDNCLKNASFGRAMLELISFAVMVILYFLIVKEVLAGVALAIGGVVFFIAAFTLIISAVTSLLF